MMEFSTGTNPTLSAIHFVSSRCGLRNSDEPLLDGSNEK